MLSYNRSGDTITFIIQDGTGAKIETHTCNRQDKKKYASLLRYFKDKYGFSPEIDVRDSVNEKTPQDEINWWE